MIILRVKVGGWKGLSISFIGLRTGRWDGVVYVIELISRGVIVILCWMRWESWTRYTLETINGSIDMYIVFEIKFIKWKLKVAKRTDVINCLYFRKKSFSNLCWFLMSWLSGFHNNLCFIRPVIVREIGEGETVQNIIESGHFIMSDKNISK